MLNVLKTALILLLLNSCVIAPPDGYVCLELDPGKGYCKKTQSDEQKEVTGEDWAQLKAKSLIVPFESWEALKTYILKTEYRAGQ